MTPESPTASKQVRLTPHEFYGSLAMNAMWRLVNDQLLSMTDDQAILLMDVAEMTAQTVLRQAHVPDDWITLLHNFRRERTFMLRVEARDLVYQQMTDPFGDWSQFYSYANQLIDKLVTSEHRNEVRDTFLSWEGAAARTLEVAIDEAFHLGLRYGRDPKSLLFDDGDDGDDGDDE